MTIRVALNHRTTYTYDRLINLGPQIARLRPAPHCRTPVLSYSLKITPEDHFLNWQQDPHGNFQARAVFTKPAKSLCVEVDLIAEMTVINPFEFFVEESAETFPFEYPADLKRELQPFLECESPGPLTAELLAGIDRTPRRTVDFVVDLNAQLQRQIEYQIRMEPGVQTPEETLKRATGSCRDSAWLLVQLLRHQGIAARFVSGYLIQLAPDVKSLDGPSGTEVDFTDLHAWAEVYLPGAGWVGLDPTSGLLAGEGHLPLACTPEPTSAAPISGALDECEVEFDFAMSVTRIHEDPRVTRPYSDDDWQKILATGTQVDERLNDGDVRLTMGGEPTFVSIDDMEGEEWTTAAVGVEKRRLSEILIKKLRSRFADGAFLHYGQGKWYPGESLPRWALGCYWRKDGVPAWRNADLIADVDRDYGFGVADAERFAEQLTKALGVTSEHIVAVYEDVAHYLLKEQRLPVNVSPEDSKLQDPEERARLADVFAKGVGEPVGFVLPLRRPWWQAKDRPWMTGPWPVRPDRMFLLPGDSPIGLRLPLDSLPWVPQSQQPVLQPPDPLLDQGPLPEFDERPQSWLPGQPEVTGQVGVSQQQPAIGSRPTDGEPNATDPQQVVRTALCVEPRQGRLHIFMPPVEVLEDYLELLTLIEATAESLQMPVVLEGYLPPHDVRLQNMKVTPDPGVIEVNVHPAGSWDELVDITEGIYDEARQTRLGTDKFDLDGTHTGTGGGNHIVLGGVTPADSPFLRRPDMLKSFVGYWLNHPSLSYLFSGKFIGPTSQAPRVDEGRADAIYELELAFSLVPDRSQQAAPWLVDRLFRNLLIDLTGNTHRAEFCIDKLYSPDSSTGRLGLLELRGFEMPPHPQMNLTQQLLIRAMAARFWETPYDQPLVHWGTQLHDRCLMPHFVWRDFADVISDLSRCGFDFDAAWFAPQFEFRFPRIGELECDGLHLELRSAIEPWYVLGEEPASGGTVRFVDSSVERLQVKVTGMTGDRYVVTCNGRRVPLHPTGVPGEFVGGVRYRAWCPPSCLHPTIPVHVPLVFDLLDQWSQRSVGGCTYYVENPTGRNSDVFPVNAYEAESRRAARFFPMGHTPGDFRVPPVEPNPAFPMTLDMRRTPMT
ncbi:MAG: transglutaminase family protein [Planctomycetaceae bacterium]|nr:transglutaminase family protein [Planctomycetaceae bacterium]